MIKWFKQQQDEKAEATGPVQEEPKGRIPDEVLKARIEARLSAARIRAAVDAEFSKKDDDPLESTFDVPANSDELVFVADGSNIGVEVLDEGIEYDPEMLVDYGKDVPEIETAWGSIGTREEAQFKKSLKR